MSQLPVFSYKQYLDDMLRLKDHGTKDVDAQVERPISAGSRGLKRTKDFIKDPVHMMGENAAGSPTPANLAEKKKITKNAAIKAVLEGVSYSNTSGELILPEAIQGNVRTWFESNWNKIKNKK